MQRRCVVSYSGDFGGVPMASPSPSSLSLPSSSPFSGSSVQWTATKWQRGDEKEIGAPGAGAFIAELQAPMVDGW